MNIEESEIVQICLGGLAPKSGAFRTAVCTREKTPSFFDLQSMLLIEENHAGASTSTHTDNRMLYTEEIGPVDVEDETSQCAMEAADEIKVECTEMMPTAIPDPPEIGGVEAMRTSKVNPPRNVGIVARKATGRASAGKARRFGETRFRIWF